MSLDGAPGERSEKDILKTGSHPPYRWLTSTRHYISTLVQLCPEVVFGRQLAVTSIDSGPGWLTNRQRDAGWQVRSGIIYSPHLSTTDDLFYQCDGVDVPGYDEWYLFEANAADLGELITGNPFEPANAPRPGRLMVFVNQLAFAIDDRDPFLVDKFWRQLDWIRPESYIGDGMKGLTFVSKNASLFDAVCERLNATLSGGFASRN